MKLVWECEVNWAAGEQDTCHFQVHTPHWVTRYGKKYLVTRMCLVKFDFKRIDGMVAIKVGMEASLCFSEPWTSHGSQEWYCEESKKQKWWKYNPGWLEREVQ